MSRRYPLEPLCSLRRRERQQRADALARQAQRSQRAGQQAQAVRRARQAQQECSRRVAASERQLLEEGLARAADLQQTEAWSRGAEQRDAELAEVQRAAQQRARAEQQAERQACQALGSADAEAQLIERHQQRWRRDLVREHERAEQEAAEELCTARTRRRRRRRDGGDQ